MSANFFGWRALAFAVALVAVPGSLLATTVRIAGLDELVHESHMVVRAHVAFVDERAGEETRKFQTRIGLEVAESVKGFDAGQTTYELVLPGGKLGPYTMAIPGMPIFAPGQEVVLLVKHTEAGDTITGLGQGIFNVDRRSGEARARRLDAGDARMVDVNGRDARLELIDAPLVELMTRLRALSAEVPR
ncbi:MAG TPA: hypothetical protein VLC93_10350 [Myxococcota bacterium]|nr:hypothetical protein [Myxococcota bacterium]